MSWFKKRAMSDVLRIQRNITRLEDLKKKIHDLGGFVLATQSGGFQVLSDLLNENIVLGRPNIRERLESALIGENNQKVALDSPQRFQQIMIDVESLVEREIGKEKRGLREILSEEKDD